MIYVIANTKGGVGKTTTAVNLGCLLFFKNRNFKIVEIDNNNNSMIFSNSEILKNKGITVRTDEKAKAIGGIFFNLAKNPEMDYIVDIGGGDDLKQIIESLKELNLPKTYLIPATSDKKYLKNAVDTFKLIDDTDNTYFILNRCYAEDEKNEFMYFFGNKKLGVKPVDDILKDAKYFKIPYSNFYQIAEDEEQTLLDLALISIEKDETEITKDFMEMSNGDEVKFIELWETYEKSKEAAKLFIKISENMKPIFFESTTKK
jgi:hypothetical protein